MIWAWIEVSTTKYKKFKQLMWNYRRLWWSYGILKEEPTTFHVHLDTSIVGLWFWMQSTPNRNWAEPFCCAWSNQWHQIVLDWVRCTWYVCTLVHVLLCFNLLAVLFFFFFFKWHLYYKYFCDTAIKLSPRS